MVKPGLEKLSDLLEGLSEFVMHIKGGKPLERTEIRQAQAKADIIYTEMRKRQDLLGRNNSTQIQVWLSRVVAGDTSAPKYYQMCKEKIESI